MTSLITHGFFSLRKKSDVLSIFIEFRIKVEKQLSAKILSFQSDLWEGGGKNFRP